MRSIYNTPLAMATRAAIILAARSSQTREEKVITAIDLLATHAQHYGLGDLNLHGDVEKPSIELAARTHHMKQGIKFAVLHGLLIPKVEARQLRYSLAHQGERFLEQIETYYRDQYEHQLSAVLAYIDTHTYDEVLNFITRTDIQGDLS